MLQDEDFQPGLRVRVCNPNGPASRYHNRVGSVTRRGTIYWVVMLDGSNTVSEYEGLFTPSELLPA